MRACPRESAVLSASPSDRHEFGEDEGRVAWIEAIARNRVDFHAERLLQHAVQAREVEQTWRAVEIDQQIEIAVGAGFTAGVGAEYRKTGDPELGGEFRLHRAKA